MTCLALLSLFSLNAEPQGPSFHAASTPSTLAFPVHPETLGHVPFRDIGDTPLTANVRRFGTLDLDGNQISDAFWLGDAAGAHELQIAMGREQTAGRFRAWPVPHNLPNGIADAAALRQDWIEQDTLLLADPNAQYLTRLSFDLAMSGDPHLNGWFTTTPFFAIPPQLGAVEITSANIEGDGCDDVAVAYDRGAQGFSIVKFALDAPFGMPMLLGSTSIDLPWTVRDIKLLDFDGDGRGDIAAELPGLGVVIARDDGSGQLQPMVWVPVSMGANLAVGRFASSDALALAMPYGVLTLWLDGGLQQWHWLPAAAGTTTAHAALLPRGTSVEVVAAASNGRILRLQTLERGMTPDPASDIEPLDPAAWMGSFAPCGLGTADIDGDGDTDLLLQHPDGQQWVTLRHEHTSQRPGLISLTQDLSLVSLGWYGATFTISVPAHWNLTELPQIELQVMVEHPYTGEQLRWDRHVEMIDPVTYTATFGVWWQDSSQIMNDILAGTYPVPSVLTMNGEVIAGCRTQLNFLGFGLGNAGWNGGERRTEPLLIYTDPGGNGNKSAQGVVWQPPEGEVPLAAADDDLLPWQ